MDRLTARFVRAALALSLLFVATPTAPAAASTPAAEHPVDVIVRYRGNTVSVSDFRRMRAAVGAVADRGRVVTHRAVAFKDLSSASAERLVAELGALPGVAYATVLGPIRATGLPAAANDTHYTYDPDVSPAGQQIYLGDSSVYPNSIDLEPAWDRAFNGTTSTLDPVAPAITVAVIDTGVSFSYRENPGTYVGGYDYVNDDSNPADDNAYYRDYHGNLVYDPIYHGSHVASIIKAQADNRFGIAGAARGTKVRILAYKVLDKAGEAYGGADAYEAIQAAADAGAKVINCSFATVSSVSQSESLAWNDAIDYATSKGATVVCASGNDSYRNLLASVGYPAAAYNAIAVGAIDPYSAETTRSSFSNGGTRLDVVAPGQYIWGMTAGDQADAWDGTSFASPLVAGSLAFLWSLVPNASSSYMSNLVTRTAEDVGPTGWDRDYGYGKIDVWTAYQRMMAEIPQQEPVSGLRLTSRSGVLASIAWDATGRSGTVYRYGFVGGPEYTTTSTSATLALPGSGDCTVYVRSYVPDRWNDSSTATMSVTVDGSHPQLTTERVGGSGAYATALDASQRQYTTAKHVVLASSATWPDALSAAPLAAAADGPLLLTSGSSLSFALRDELVRLHPSTVYAVGGSATLSDSLLSTVAKVTGATVVRVAGSNRYSTSAAVASKVRALQGGTIPDARAVVVSGESYADALSAGPLAAHRGWPILLTASKSLSSQTSSAISRLGIRRTLIVGGTVSVNSSVQAKLPSAVRVSGTDRYDASRKLADYAVGKGWLSFSDIGLASGTTFPYALSAAGTLASRGAPLVLGTGSERTLRSWMRAKGGNISRVDFFGPFTVSQVNSLVAAVRN